MNTNVKSGTSGTGNKSSAGSGILGQTVGGLFGAASFATDVAGGIVRGIVGVLGSGFKIGAGILGGLASVLGSVIGGTDSADDVTITVVGISPTPSVYRTYNCNIFRNAGDNNRLSYFDENDILTITNINQ